MLVNGLSMPCVRGEPAEVVKEVHYGAGRQIEGKRNALTFELGTQVVTPGINEMVANMGLGEKVQAIVPPALGFGDKGLCLDDGECLIKPGATLVYDIYLKRIAIPPP